MPSLNGLREYKYYLIGEMKRCPTEKKKLNKLTREIDKEIKKLLTQQDARTTDRIRKENDPAFYKSL